MNKVFLWGGAILLTTIFLAGCSVGNFDSLKQKPNDVFRNKTQDKKTGVNKIFLVALDGSELIKTLEGEKFGCDDKLLAVEFGKMTPRQAVEKLFSYTDKNPDLYNALSKDNVPLKVADLIINENGLATLRITGDSLGGGTCDAPRIQKQIRETLIQFENIKDVKVYFNNESLESYLSEKD